MIIQGSNEPILLTFGMDMSDISALSAGLFCKATGATLKQWDLSDAVVGEPSTDDYGNVSTQIELPLTEEETFAFPYGTAILEVKWKADDDDIWIADRQEIHVQRSLDTTRLNNE